MKTPPCRSSLFNKMKSCIAILTLALLPQWLPAATLTFTPGPPRLSTTFTSLGAGDPITNLPGWSGVDDIVAATPRDSARNPRPVVMTTSNTSYRTVTGPVQPLSPPFANEETLYFSAWFNWSGSASSNARVFLLDSHGVALGAFGLAEKKFGMADSSLEWTYSTEQIVKDVWYEVALAVNLNSEDPALSRGYLFVRKVGVDTEFHLLEGFEDGIVMKYEAGVTAADFAKWEIGLRNGAQLDELTAGTAVIPEPGATASIVGAGLLIAVAGFRKRQTAG